MIRRPATLQRHFAMHSEDVSEHMNHFLRTITFSMPLVFLLVPASASALTISQIAGLFHMVFGLFIVFTFLIFGAGVSIWAARFNTWPNHRDQAIKVLQWAVGLIFILMLLVGLVQFVQRYTSIALTILAAIVIIGVLILIVRHIATKKKASASPAAAKRPAAH